MLFSFENNSQKTDIGLLIIRLGVGLMMLFSHGWPKLIKLLNDDPIQFADPFGLGAGFSLFLTVFAEVLCSILITLGLFTRGACIPLIITMLVAAFIIHADDPFGKKEFALLYLIPYVLILLSGAGRYSLDALFQKKSNAV